MKGEDGSEMFEEGVVLARQFLGKGQWLVWDLRPGSATSCKECSSDAERLVRHERGTRCPKGVAKNSAGHARGLLAQEAVAARTARIAVAAAPDPAEGEELGGEVTIERDGIEAAEERQGAAHQGEAAIEANASETPRAVVASKVVS